MLFTAVYAFGVTYFILKVVDNFVPIRVPEEAEEKGLDESIHGEVAYR
jgi:Amt family ammonium transporter